MNEKEVNEFEENLYNLIGEEIPKKLYELVENLPSNIDNNIIKSIKDIVGNLEDAAYEYRQFNKDLNEYLFNSEEDKEVE